MAILAYLGIECFDQVIDKRRIDPDFLGRCALFSPFLLREGTGVGISHMRTDGSACHESLQFSLWPKDVASAERRNWT